MEILLKVLTWNESGFSDFNAHIVVTFTRTGSEKSKLKFEILVRIKCCKIFQIPLEKHWYKIISTLLLFCGGGGDNVW